jgi:ABC-type bacteriocin/lantibiotic exporter with double-glycine peptidase domain
MIKFENVSLSYESTAVLTQFSDHFPLDGLTVIKGLSGSGKSSLIKLLLGFKTPDEGSILFNEERITSSNIWSIRQLIAYVPQSFPLFDGIVQEFVSSIFNLNCNRSLGSDRSPQPLVVLTDYLPALSLPSTLLSQSYSVLSGGEKQRLFVAISLTLAKPLILFDEPTSSLDPYSKDQVVQLIAEASGTRIVVSHDKEWDQVSSANTVMLS